MPLAGGNDISSVSSRRRVQFSQDNIEVDQSVENDGYDDNATIMHMQRESMSDDVQQIENRKQPIPQSRKNILKFSDHEENAQPTRMPVITEEGQEDTNGEIDQQTSTLSPRPAKFLEQL